MCVMRVCINMMGLWQVTGDNGRYVGKGAPLAHSDILLSPSEAVVVHCWIATLGRTPPFAGHWRYESDNICPLVRDPALFPKYQHRWGFRKEDVTAGSDGKEKGPASLVTEGQLEGTEEGSSGARRSLNTGARCPRALQTRLINFFTLESCWSGPCLQSSRPSASATLLSTSQSQTEAAPPDSARLFKSTLNLISAYFFIF